MQPAALKVTPVQHNFPKPLAQHRPRFCFGRKISPGRLGETLIFMRINKKATLNLLHLHMKLAIVSIGAINKFDISAERAWAVLHPPPQLLDMDPIACVYSREIFFCRRREIFGQAAACTRKVPPAAYSAELFSSCSKAWVHRRRSLLDKSMINADVIQEGAQARAFLSAYPPFRR